MSLHGKSLIAGVTAERMFADRVQVQQVLVTLLRNAAQAMRDLPSEQKRISIDAAPLSGEMLEIRVRDHGPGFPQHVLDELFSPFLSTRESQHSMGIGMSICRRIVDAHGGEMHASNHEDGGACVAFTVPRPEQFAE